MREFTIFLDVGGDWIPVSSPINNNETLQFSTYNEQLNEGKHSQYTLNFSLVAKQMFKDEVSGVNILSSNPLLSYYFIGARMYIIIDQQKRIDLIIKDIQPENSELNSILNITAEDEVTYLWAKHNINYSYSTINASDSDLLQPKNIYQITREVLKDNFLDYKWSVTSQTQDLTLPSKKFTFEINNSNPYNTIIEACNIVGAELIVNYNTKLLDFVDYKNKTFSGYRYAPEYNLHNYTSSYEGTELTTVLHVSGGTDADERQITMVPPLPTFVKKYIADTISNGGQFANWNDIEGAVSDMIKNYTPSAAFVPIVRCTTGANKETELMDKATYIVRYNDTKGQYFGEISFETISKKNPSYHLYTFPINPEANNPFGVEGYVVNNNTLYDVELQYYLNGQLDSDNISATIYQNNTDIVEYRQKVKTQIENELKEFFSITQKNDYLGQFLIDFSPFRGKMSINDWEYLHSLIHTTYRNLNIQLQYYSEELYTYTGKLFKLRQMFISYAENYAAACSAYEEELNSNKKARDTSWDTYLNNINKAMLDLENVIKNSKYFDIIQKLGYSDELDIPNNSSVFSSYFLKLVNDTQERINMYQSKILELYSDSVEDGDNFNEEHAYYTGLIKTAQTLCSRFSFKINRDFAPGAYELVVSLINKYAPKPETISSNGIKNKFDAIQAQINQQVFKILYQNYGQYIYEQTYSNTDELNSISLYNQAVVHFADINKIKESHSLTVLDIGMLERIALPRLSVGSVIQVYNKDSLNAIPYNYITNRIEKATALYEYALKQGRQEQLVQLEGDLENLQKELVDYYKYINNIEKTTSVTAAEILDKIFTDEIQVVGINRILREPLKDTVTVEQPSRYQSILAKLIKSI